MASIIPLPNATTDRIINVRWRGRYPKNITPIWRLRNARSLRDMKRQEHEAAIAKAKEQINAARSHAAAWEEYLYSIQQEWQRNQG